MQNIFRLRLGFCVHVFAVMVGPGNFSLYVHTCVCNILCRILSAYRCKCCRTFHVCDLSAVRFGLGIQGTVDKWRSYNLCIIFSVATHSPGHLPIRLVKLTCRLPLQQAKEENQLGTDLWNQSCYEGSDRIPKCYDFQLWTYHQSSITHGNLQSKTPTASGIRFGMGVRSAQYIWLCYARQAK